MAVQVKFLFDPLKPSINENRENGIRKPNDEYRCARRVSNRCECECGGTMYHADELKTKHGSVKDVDYCSACLKTQRPAPKAEVESAPQVSSGE